MQHLLLQRHGRRGHHETFAARFGYRQRGQQIGQGFSRAGARFKHADMFIAAPLTLIVHLNAPQRASNFGNHQLLAVARRQGQRLKHAAIGGLDIVLYRIVEHVGEPISMRQHK